MKVILCTPYIQSPEFAHGGLVVWGANIVKHYKRFGEREVELIPISFDRRTYAENHSSKLGAFFNGIKELWYPTYTAIKLLRRKEVDAIHVCTSIGLSVLKDTLILFAAKHFGVRSYIHFHCGRIPIVLVNCDWEHKFFMTVTSLATKCITMDLRSYQALTAYGVNNVVNLPNPLSTTIINQVSKKKNYVAKIPGRIAFVGHVIRSKGIFELIESCCKLGKPDLHIIGKLLPNDKAEIDALLNKYNTDGSWITWVGEIPHTKVIDELLEAEIFAFPSYTEGFPNVILEAMVCSCAIISTTVGAIPEMLDVDGDPCGLCVEPQNVESFTNAICSVYANKDLINSFSVKAEKRVNEEYTINKVWEQMINIWSS